MSRFALRSFLIGAACLAGLCAAHAQDSVTFSGKAAYYDPDYKGKTTSGEPYDGTKFTAAHKTLPFGTRLRVTDTRTGRSTLVVVNDRGPFTPGRIIDLSLAAAKEIGMIKRGIIAVTVTVLAPDKPAAAVKTGD
ncbi:MAG: septal ring lytic transglycosylase RlpA family protein [Xanthobacteraceae bacterium]|uniref:septal ring lytic transglycosylase RlpA family protein n=1 Tax=Pseudolabrys sp. TaxID=1960880 RepID=UPI003D0BCF84